MSGFRKPFMGGLAISMVFGMVAGMVAHADRYKVHTFGPPSQPHPARGTNVGTAPGVPGICISRVGDSPPECNRDVEESAVLIGASEVDDLVGKVREYCTKIDSETAELRSEMRHLADANDALSKRVSDLDALSKRISDLEVKVAAQTTKHAGKTP